MRNWVRPLGLNRTCLLPSTPETSAVDAVSSNVEIITTDGLPSIASMVAAGMESVVAATVAEATATSKAAATEIMTTATSTATDTPTKGTKQCVCYSALLN